MKIIIANNSDSNGGAARVAYRLMYTFNESGHMAKMWVQHKATDNINVVGPQSKFGMGFGLLRYYIDVFPVYIYYRRKRIPFYLQWLPKIIHPEIKKTVPEIIHLNWICRGFLSIESFARIKKPVIWTLHDMWPFTGGCNYSGDCERYQKSCGKCPQLHSKCDKDLSYWTWFRKRRAFQKLNLTIVSPSQWLSRCAQRSLLFRERRIEVIPNGVDINIFKPIQKTIARKILNLSKDKKIILFGAIKATDDFRKGFNYLEGIFELLRQATITEKCEIVVFGSSEPKDQPQFGFNTTYMGYLYDDVSLALLYSSADIFIAPSIEDNLPNTVMEALACGTPCVAFDIGGMPDMIDHGYNGYLARPFEVEEFAKGVHTLLTLDDSQMAQIRVNARNKVLKDFDITKIAGRYLRLFEEIIGNRSVNLGKSKF
jgi:glycosyltransferase involved in cell wall biosynthesis